jgi:hypothetical protein
VPFDGGDRAPRRLHGEEAAGLHRLAVEEDGAGAALAGVASDVCPGLPGDLAQVVHQEQARLDRILAPDAVDGDRDALSHSPPPCAPLTPGAKRR